MALLLSCLQWIWCSSIKLPLAHFSYSLPHCLRSTQLPLNIKWTKWHFVQDTFLNLFHSIVLLSFDCASSSSSSSPSDSSKRVLPSPKVISSCMWISSSWEGESSGGSCRRRSASKGDMGVAGVGGARDGVVGERWRVMEWRLSQVGETRAWTCREEKGHPAEEDALGLARCLWGITSRSAGRHHRSWKDNTCQ